MESSGADARDTMKVVIVGAGFGGLFTARHLGRLLPKSLPAEVTILGPENFFLFSAMLPEAVTGEVEPNHIVTPVRSYLRDRRFMFHQASATKIDFEGKIVTAYCAKRHCLRMPYDYLVLAVGTRARVPDETPNGEQWVFPLKTLSDAMALHNQVIDMFEHAEMLDRDDPERKAMLTFVTVGGDYAGVEAAASLHDMIFSTLLPQYPRVSPDEVEMIVLHKGPAILPALGDELASYVARLMESKKVDVRLGVGASLPGPGLVGAGDAVIPTSTVIWTAGTMSEPLIDALDLAKDKNGRIVVDEFSRCTGHTDIFALGDCTHQENPKTKQPYPPTAQVAMKQAKVVAANIVASATGRQLTPFTFDVMGTVVPLGHRSAAAIVKGVRIRGFVGWWLARTIRLMRLPTWSNRIRVALDWFLDLFFSKDTTRITMR